MNAYGLHGLQSVALTTDNPPSDQMPKIQRGVICSEFEKKQGGTLTINFQNLSHLKKNKGGPYYQFSKFESPEKKNKGGPLLLIFET